MNINEFTIKMGDITIKYNYSKNIEITNKDYFFNYINFDEQNSFDIYYSINIVDRIDYSINHNKIIAKTKYWIYWTNGKNNELVFLNKNKEPYAFVIIDNFIYNKIYILEDAIKKSKILPSDLGAFLLMGFINENRKAVLIHGSAILFNNKAIIFSGYSGSGKSTISNIANKFYDLPIISDDRLLISKNKKMMMYSTIFNPKSKSCIKSNVEILAIVYLEHSKDNYITNLSYSEKFEYLLQTNLLPFYCENGIKNNFIMYDEIIKNIKIIKFNFVKDESCINYLFNYLEGES